jgi:hypothetical protein
VENELPSSALKKRKADVILPQDLLLVKSNFWGFPLPEGFRKDLLVLTGGHEAV